MLDVCCGFFVWKVGSIGPSGVQKHFCRISGSRDISKTIFGIRYQKFWIWDNLLSWKLMPHIVFLNFQLSHVVQSWVWTWNMLLDVTLKNSWKHKYGVVSDSNISKSWNLLTHCFAYILAPWYCTEIFL